MENLEKYIQDNLEQFNSGEMPAGHQERFLAKLGELQAQEEKQATARPRRLLTRKSLFTASAAAASIIIALFVTLQQESEEKYIIGIQELAQEMYMEEAQILQMIPKDEHIMINSVKSITQEAIPLTEQLPDELSPEKRAEILREYYKAKTAGLKKIKTLYAQSDQIID